MAEHGIQYQIIPPSPGSAIFFNEFSGLAVDDDDLLTGNGFLLQGVLGLDYAEIRANVTDLPNQGGGYVHKAWLGGKTVTLSGIIVADTPEQRQILSDGLLGALDAMVEGDGTIYWTPFGATIRWHTCQLLEPVEIVSSGNIGDPKSFQIQLLCTPVVNT